MNVLPLTKAEINDCVEIYLKVYNKPPWNYNFTVGKAIKYLTEYTDKPRFVGFVLKNNGRVEGAIFGHAKTWWTDDLLYIDEIFVSPSKQGVGYGKILMEYAEKYAKDNGYGVSTLMTNKHMPALEFYERRGYIQAEHFVFLFKPLAGTKNQ